MLLIWVMALSFTLSCLFALGGVGSAVVLVPALMGMGIPAGIARPAGLLVNVVSLGGASFQNYKSGKFRAGSWLPLILFSIPGAPLGAWLSSWVSRDALLGLFAFFMVFSGVVMILPFRKKREPGKCSPVKFALLGSASGIISGLLGVGGGGVIVPALHLMGFQARQIAMVTALAVPFSSLTGFMAYAAMGSIDLGIFLGASVAALAGGIIGTRMMHRIDQGRIRSLLAISVMVSGVRILWKLF